MTTNVNKNTNKANSLSPQDVQTVLAALMKLASDRPAMESRPEPVILPAVAEGLASIRRQCLRDWLGGPQAPAYLNEGLRYRLFHQAQRDFKLQFEVSRFDMIRQGDKQAALDFWAKWQPASALRQAIQACNEREGQDL